MTALDYLVLIYSAYLHDMGMVLTKMEREEILNSIEFQENLKSWSAIDNALADARKQHQNAKDENKPPIEFLIYQLQEAALANFLRPLHASPSRYRQFIEMIKKNSGRDDLFSIKGVSFEEILIDICASHYLDVSVLAELIGAHDDRFPRKLPIGGYLLNSQYCAAVLRLADILDFDRERTPKILFESIDISSSIIPGAEVSLLEWRKHIAVHCIEVEQNEVIISGDCEHPAIESAIRKFCKEIEYELGATQAVLKRNPPEIAESYQIEMPMVVRPRIRSKGYIFKDLALRLNESAIMSLLMGDRLYNEPYVFARELIQNALDACKVREHLGINSEQKPQISIRGEIDNENRCWVIVSDNGIGMDEYVLSKYFFSIGSCYYNSVDFDRLIRRFGKKSYFPISRFGIGILSVFMMGDQFEVLTRSAYSEQGDTICRNLRVERVGTLAFVTEKHTDKIGTTFRVRLKHRIRDDFDEILDGISQYLKYTILRPFCTIDINIGRTSFEIAPNTFYSMKAGANETLKKLGIEPVLLNIGQWSDTLKGMVLLLFGKSSSDGSLSDQVQGKNIDFTSTNIPNRHFINPHLFINEYSGNKISVNGIRMGMRQVGRVFRRGSRYVALVLDIDVIGGSEIVYGVSRGKLIEKGSLTVRHALRKAVLKGLKDLEIYDRLGDRTKRLFGIVETGEEIDLFAQPRRLLAERTRRLDDEKILDSVKKEIPTNHWPIGLHSIIAEKLGLSRSTAYRAISTLTETLH